jgi:predicted AlkP superfamily phosphohydrolase/phosphomutase
LFWMVEMGVDRIHHGFWRFSDPQHRQYQPGNAYENAIHDYYVFVDRQIGELLDVLDLGRTAVWVVSDHGAKRLEGGFCINDWLIREGLLAMKTPVTGRRRFELSDVDWSRTKVWGDGGYTGQCFINRAGREPQGIVPADQYEALRAEVAAKIEALADHAGRSMGNRAFTPERLYKDITGFPPDLIVLFGDLHWRSVGTLG